jgi:hypothetical protein
MYEAVYIRPRMDDMYGPEGKDPQIWQRDTKKEMGFEILKGPKVKGEAKDEEN